MMTFQNVLLTLIFCGLVVDVWYTRKWLAASRRALEEMQKQTRGFMESMGNGEENGRE